jgi:hypothetical protein
MLRQTLTVDNGPAGIEMPEATKDGVLPTVAGGVSNDG